MTDNACTDIIARLSALTETSGYTYYIYNEPSSPDNVVTLYNTTSLALDCLDGSLAENQNIQIRVRNNDYLTAREYSNVIRDALNCTTFTTLSTYYSISRIGSTVDLRRDESNRAIVVQNYNVIRSET